MRIRIFKNAGFGDPRRKPIGKARTIRTIEGMEPNALREEARNLCVEFDRMIPGKQLREGFRHEWEIIS